MYLRRFMGKGVEEFTDSQHYIFFTHTDEYYEPLDVGTYTCIYNNENYEITIKHVAHYKSSGKFITKYYFDQDNNVCPRYIVNSDGNNVGFTDFCDLISLEFSENIQYVFVEYNNAVILKELILPNNLIHCEIYCGVDNIDVINTGENLKELYIASCNNINTINYNAIDCEHFQVNVNNIEKCYISNSIKSMPRGNLNYLYNITNKYTFSTFYGINQLYPYSLSESINTSDENDMAILHQSACENNKTLQCIYDSKIIPFNCYNRCNIVLTNPKNRKDIVYIFKGNKFINSKIISISYFWYLCYAYELYNFDLSTVGTVDIKIIKTLILDNNFNKDTILIPDCLTYVYIQDTSDYTKKLEIYTCNNQIVQTNKVYDETEMFYIGKNIDVTNIRTKRMIIPISASVIGYFDNNLESIKFNSATQLPEDIFIGANNLTSIEGYLNTYIDFSKTAFYKNLPVDEYGCIYYNNCLIGYDKTQNQHIIEGSNYLDVVINENCTRILIPFSNFNDTNVFIPANVNIIYPSAHVTANITIDENNYYYDVINNHIITNASRTDGKHIITVYNESSPLNDIDRSYYLYTNESLETKLSGDVTNVIFNGTVITTDTTTFNNGSIYKLIPRNGDIIINNDNNTTTITTLALDKYSQGQINITGNYKINNVNISNINKSIYNNIKLIANNIIIVSFSNSNELDLSNDNYEQVYVSIHDVGDKSIYLSNSVKKLHIEDMHGYVNNLTSVIVNIYYNGTFEELLNLSMNANLSKFKNNGKVITKQQFVFNFYYYDNGWKSVYETDLNILSNYKKITNKFIFNSIGKYYDISNKSRIIVIPNSITQLSLHLMSEQHIDLRNLSNNAIVSISFNYNYLTEYGFSTHYIYLNSNTFKILSNSFNSGTVTGPICLYYDGYKSDLINDLCTTEFGKKLMQTCVCHDIVDISSADWWMFTAYCYDGKLEL